MTWNWIALLYVFQIVRSLDHGTSSLPLTSSNKLNKGRHKTSKITNYSMESAVDAAYNEVHESLFPDVIYPTNILEAAQPFYYSQHVYDEVLGPFSNDIKSTYKSLAADKGKTTLADCSTSQLLDHKNIHLLNQPSITNDTSSNTTIESEQYSLSEEDLETSKQNSTNSEETVRADNTSCEEIYQDVSKEDSSINEQDLSGEYIEERYKFPAIENYTSSNEDLPEAHIVNKNNRTESNQDHVSPNHFMVSEMNNQDDTESLYPTDSNKILYINLTPTYFITSDTSSSHNSKEILDRVNSEDTSYENFTSNYAVTSDTSNDREETDTENFVMLTNATSNEVDTEISETRNYYNTDDVNPTSNIVVTSATGNTREDFVSDIMNIYSLIEETLRANVNTGSTTNSEGRYYNVSENN